MDLGTENPHAADTIFHIAKGYDVAFCGHIDRSVQPIVYSEFTLRTYGHAHVAIHTKDPVRECLISVATNMLVVDELRMLPSGPEMKLARLPCWRNHYVQRPNEDTAQYAINLMRELIAPLQRPTPAQVAQVQARFDALHSTIYWTDKELLGQVFLCAVFDTTWAKRFHELREQYMFGGAVATFYDELLAVFLVKSSAGTSK